MQQWFSLRATVERIKRPKWSCIRNEMNNHFDVAPIERSYIVTRTVCVFALNVAQNIYATVMHENHAKSALSEVHFHPANHISFMGLYVCGA